MAIDTDIRPTRACRPSLMRRPTCVREAFRSPEEQAEIDRRVAIYARQVERRGHITFLKRRDDGD